MSVLVVDVGGSNVKILATGQDQPRKFSSGPRMAAKWMVSGVKELAGDWKYDVVLGGGNVKKFKELPPGCRAGDNANAYLDGFRLWEAAGTHSSHYRQQPRNKRNPGVTPSNRDRS